MGDPVMLPEGWAYHESDETDEVQVACALCGTYVTMPMEGEPPETADGTIDHGRMLPIVERYARVLEGQCRYAWELSHFGRGAA